MTRGSWLAGLLLVAVGCKEDVVPGRLPVGSDEGGVADAMTPIDFRRDGAVDSGRDTGVGEGGIADGSTSDAGLLPACTVRDTSTLVSATATSAFTPVISVTGESAVVVWEETRGSNPDVFTRLVPSTGSLGTELQLTTDLGIETGLALVRSGSSYVLVYSLATVAPAPVTSDLASVTFDLVGLTLVGSNELTLDTSVDLAPRITPMLDGFFVTWDRGSTGDVGRMTLTTAGAPIDPYEDSNPTRTFGSPFAINEASGDVRLAYRTSTTVIDSFRLGSDGLVATPSEVAKTYSFSSATLGNRIESTAPGASPRAFLTTATRSARPTAFVVMLDADGDLLAPIREVDARSIAASAVATHAGILLVAYRTTEGLDSVIRLRGFDVNGALVLDQRLETIGDTDGTIALAEYASGALVVVYDEPASTKRELRALRVDCGF